MRSWNNIFLLFVTSSKICSLDKFLKSFTEVGLSPVNSSAAAASPSARTTTDARFCVRALATETYSFARAFTHHRIRQSFNSSLCARSPLLAVCLSPLSGFRPFAHASSRAFPRLSRRLRARDRDRTTFRFLSHRAPTGPRSHRPSHPRASPSIHPHRRRHPPRRVGRLHPPDSTAPPPLVRVERNGIEPNRNSPRRLVAAHLQASSAHRGGGRHREHGERRLSCDVARTRRRGLSLGRTSGHVCFIF